MIEWFSSYILMLCSVMFAYLLNKFPTRKKTAKVVANIVFYFVLFMAFRLMGRISRTLEIQLEMNFYLIAFPLVCFFMLGIIISRFLLTKYLVVITSEKEEVARK